MVVLWGSVVVYSSQNVASSDKAISSPVWDVHTDLLHFTIVHKSNEPGTVDVTTFPVFIFFFPL